MPCWHTVRHIHKQKVITLITQNVAKLLGKENPLPASPQMSGNITVSLYHWKMCLLQLMEINELSSYCTYFIHIIVKQCHLVVERGQVTLTKKHCSSLIVIFVWLWYNGHYCINNLPWYRCCLKCLAWCWLVRATISLIADGYWETWHCAASMKGTYYAKWLIPGPSMCYICYLRLLAEKRWNLEVASLFCSFIVQKTLDKTGCFEKERIMS